MSFTASSVNVAEAKQNVAPGSAAISQSQRLCLLNLSSVVKTIHVWLRLKRIPVREETRPSVVLVRVHHLWTASQWSGLWLLRGGTCDSSRQMVLTGNRLSCFWTASSETLVMVERMTRGLGSIPSITAAIFSGSTSSRDRKGMPQVWQTLTRDHDAPSNHLFSKGLPVATAAGSQLEAGWPGTPPLMIQWGLFYYLVQLTSVVHQGVWQSNQWLATS